MPAPTKYEKSHPAHPGVSDAPPRGSAEFRIHVLDLTDGLPDLLGREAVREGRFDGPAAEPGDDEVLRPRLGVRLTEVAAHPVPEVRQTHDLTLWPGGPCPPSGPGASVPRAS